MPLFMILTQCSNTQFCWGAFGWVIVTWPSERGYVAVRDDFHGNRWGQSGSCPKKCWEWTCERRTQESLFWWVESGDFLTLWNFTGSDHNLTRWCCKQFFFSCRNSLSIPFLHKLGRIYFAINWSQYNSTICNKYVSISNLTEFLTQISLSLCECG